jgi:hypothetical protein
MEAGVRTTITSMSPFTPSLALHRYVGARQTQARCVVGKDQHIRVTAQEQSKTKSPRYLFFCSSTMSCLRKTSIPSARDDANARITTIPMTLRIITTAGISNKLMSTGKLLVVWERPLTIRNNTAPRLPLTWPV